MPLVSDASAPLVVVVGATGTQGGSVIDALSTSDKPYRIRALTRDATKSAARKLVDKVAELHEVTLAVGREGAARKAFEGATYVFAMTQFWDHVDQERLRRALFTLLPSSSSLFAQETAEGKVMVDAAKSAGVRLFIWSGLPSPRESSQGKYTKVYHFEGKAAVARYARSQLPTIEVQSGFYMTNFLSPGDGPAKQDDGSLAITTMYDGNQLLPLIDTRRDFGIFVRAAIEQHSPHATLQAVSEWLSLGEILEQLREEKGYDVTLERVDEAEFRRLLKQAGRPSHIIDDLTEDLLCTSEFGYYGGVDTRAARRHLARPLATWRDFAKTADWSHLD